MPIGARVFLFVIAFGLFAYAFTLYRNPSFLYGNWFDRQMWGWLEGHKLLRPVSLAASVLAIVTGGAVILLAVVIP